MQSTARSPKSTEVLTADPMQAAFVQFNPRYLQREVNLDRVEALIAGVEADLIVLPELFTSGYFFHTTQDMVELAEPVPEGPTTARLQRWAARSGATFVAGLPEREDDRFFNSAVVVSPEGHVGTYRKLHLYYEEKLHFTSGNRGLPVFEVTDRSGGTYRLGVMICFDWYFPEAARSLSLQGADVIAHPSNLVRKDCPRAMPIRALENHVYTVTANRCGQEESRGEKLTFIGQSVICDPEGSVLTQASRREETVGTAEISPASARDRDITLHNHLFGDRRPRSYTYE